MEARMTRLHKIVVSVALSCLIAPLAAAPDAARAESKVNMCEIPPGAPANAHMIVATFNRAQPSQVGDPCYSNADCAQGEGTLACKLPFGCIPGACPDPGVCVDFFSGAQCDSDAAVLSCESTPGSDGLMMRCCYGAELR